MAYREQTTSGTASQEGRCDIRIWSGECEQAGSTTTGDKYLCPACGIIGKLDHEMRHEVFPHVSGDYKNLY
jgi:hypothetical protein